MASKNSFNAQTILKVAGKDYEIYKVDAVKNGKQLPFSLKILLENLLRHEDNITVTAQDIEAIAHWQPAVSSTDEIQYRPARVLMQDFTGVPAVVDLAAMRDAMSDLGGDPNKINPLQPAELVIDHSVQIDYFASDDAFDKNTEMEFKRNNERYQFLKWGQNSFSNFRVVPPDTGIVHQVNIEYLSRIVFAQENNGVLQAYPDTLVGTDSHTTMVNGLGVLGWGVGGIEAEASMLGQPISMLIPQVVGFELTGQAQEGITATDIVLTIVEQLRAHGVVGKFVEFYGEAVADLAMGDRTTIANMAPEYGATCGLFPIDKVTLDYMRLTGRSEDEIALTEAYAKAQGMFLDANNSYTINYSETLSLDIGTIEASLAGPKRPQDRVNLSAMSSHFPQALTELKAERDIPSLGDAEIKIKDEAIKLGDGAVVIAAITSCTNTSNPSVMIAAGLLAKKANALGLTPKPWVKTTFGPGSMAVTKYLADAGLMDDMKALGFHNVGYGCTACIGNSGPLLPAVSKGIKEKDLSVCSVLSGNRNFEGRVHPEVRMNYLASPPLVVAYAIAGRMDIDLYKEALGQDKDGQAIYMKDIWPSNAEIQQNMQQHLKTETFTSAYATVLEGDEKWQQMQVPEGDRFDWQDDSTYIRKPPYFEGMVMQPNEISDITNARCLALFGDSITTDHISPAGAIKTDAPAGEYLQSLGIKPTDFNSYGSRRGNHEVMMRGTFANIRLRNLLAPGTEGGFTRHQPSDEQMSIYDASSRYKADNIASIILAGKEYGSGSSRDWAAKGPNLLGVKAVIAESFERIHRTNLVCMGILPLQFKQGDNAQSLGLTGKEVFNITGVSAKAGGEVTVSADNKSFQALVRIDTPNEVEYYQHGGILHFVLRKLVAEK